MAIQADRVLFLAPPPGTGPARCSPIESLSRPACVTSASRPPPDRSGRRGIERIGPAPPYGLLTQSESASETRITEKRSEIPVPPEPVDLGRHVPVYDIALLVLETPRRDDHDVTLADPGALLDLALDTSHSGHAVEASYTDMVCSHHQFGRCELLVVPLFRQTHPDRLALDAGSAGYLDFAGCLNIWSDSINSSGVMKGFMRIYIYLLGWVRWTTPAYRRRLRGPAVT